MYGCNVLLLGLAVHEFMTWEKEERRRKERRARRTVKKGE